MHSGVRLAFGSFEVDPARRRVTCAGDPVAVPDRHFDILLHLLSHAGQIVAKDDLLRAGWKDVAVGDNSLEQAISGLRRLLGPHYIETAPRLGYRFGAIVERRAARENDDALEALLAPHRAFVEGRAALETFDTNEIGRARIVFEGALAVIPEHASAHIGLANACVMQFEATRANPTPDVAALAVAVDHAREACRLDPQSGEAWSTLGFVLDRAGSSRADAIAASKRAAALEPDNWRHQFRLASVAWGEERLRAAHRTLTLLPDFPLAHWFAATVHVARQALGEAERELAAGLAAEGAQQRFRSVALHWLLGLIHLARHDAVRADEEFDRELASVSSGHLYGPETASNTWYAIGALRLRQDRLDEARVAFGRAIEHVRHPMAQLGITVIDSARSPGSIQAATRPPLDVSGSLPDLSASPPDVSPGREEESGRIESTFVRAARCALAGAHAQAATLMDQALEHAPAGNAAWLLPVEPLLRVAEHADTWARPLARLRNRAA
jgi:DNA-binding winged helix-turn-helix (wHTH) protein